MKLGGLLIVFVTITPWLLQGGLHADTLTLEDGSTYEGKVRIETSRHVYFEVRSEDATELRVFNRDEIGTLTVSKAARGVDSGVSRTDSGASSSDGGVAAADEEDTDNVPAEPPGYFLVPLRGVIGKEIAASAIEEAFKAGLRDPDTVLVLEIDSPGGLISECEAIIDLLAAEKERRTVAHIAQALSAAAIIALTCDELYLQDDATIGAAVAIQRSVHGISPVDEKFESVWRATCRRAAEIGNHDPSFAEAMLDPSLQLEIVGGGHGEPAKLAAVPPENVDSVNPERVVTTRGKLLTLTGREAVRFGLAAGTAETLDEIAEQDPTLAGWTPSSRQGVSILEAYARRVEILLPRIDEELEAAQDAFDLAVEVNPARQEYRVYGRRFTPESKARWLQYTKACYEQLKKCERALDKAVQLGKGMPFLKFQNERLTKTREEIEKIREAIKQGARRGGI